MMVAGAHASSALAMMPSIEGKAWEASADKPTSQILSTRIESSFGSVWSCGARDPRDRRVGMPHMQIEARSAPRVRAAGMLFEQGC